MTKRVDLSYARGVLGNAVGNDNLDIQELDDAIDLLDAVFAELSELRAQAQGGGWIPCSERMPEPMAEVLFAEDGAVYLGYRSSDGSWWADGSEEPVPSPCQEVTHWMPLPAPPEAT